MKKNNNFFFLFFLFFVFSFSFFCFCCGCADFGEVNVPPPTIVINGGDANYPCPPGGGDANQPLPLDCGNEHFRFSLKNGTYVLYFREEDCPDYPGNTPIYLFSDIAGWNPGDALKMLPSLRHPGWWEVSVTPPKGCYGFNFGWVDSANKRHYAAYSRFSVANPYVDFARKCFAGNFTGSEEEGKGIVPLSASSAAGVIPAGGDSSGEISGDGEIFDDEEIVEEDDPANGDSCFVQAKGISEKPDGFFGDDYIAFSLVREGGQYYVQVAFWKYSLPEWDALETWLGLEPRAGGTIEKNWWGYSIPLSDCWQWWMKTPPISIVPDRDYRFTFLYPDPQDKNNDGVLRYYARSSIFEKSAFFNIKDGARSFGFQLTQEGVIIPIPE